MGVVVYEHRKDGKEPYEESYEICAVCVRLVSVMAIHQSDSNAGNRPVLCLHNSSCGCKGGVQFWLIQDVAYHAHCATSYVCLNPCPFVGER